jgi:7-cyano-7-deazaguanine synthase in queuosine biosynthesis
MTQPEPYAINVVENSRSRSRTGDCVLGHDIRFDVKALQAATFTYLDDVDIDLLVVLATVAYADRNHHRHLGTRWSRDLWLRVPVYEIDKWRKASPHLTSVLRGLTGDAWTFEFVQRRGRNEISQHFIPGLSNDFKGATIIPYSGGLDSLAAIARVREKDPDGRVLLVNARRARRNAKLALPPNTAVVGVPYQLSVERGEITYRTRTFVYYSLAALAWHRNQARRIWIGEGGIGCLGPSLVPFGIEHPFRGSHPAFTKKLSEVMKVLWGHAPVFEFPHLWQTKGNMLADLKDADALRPWRDTKSCSRPPRRQHPGTNGSHCGVCTGCLFRRVSLLAADMPAEADGTYLEDIVSRASLRADAKPSDHEVGVCAVIAMESLARLDLAHRAGEIAELSLAIEEPEGTTRSRLYSLIKRHAFEWDAFVDQLPKKSWVRLITNARGAS